jgi:hypothetical protein
MAELYLHSPIYFHGVLLNDIIKYRKIFPFLLCPETRSLETNTVPLCEQMSQIKNLTAVKIWIFVFYDLFEQMVLSTWIGFYAHIDYIYLLLHCNMLEINFIISSGILYLY